MISHRTLTGLLSALLLSGSALAVRRTSSVVEDEKNSITETTRRLRKLTDTPPLPQSPDEHLVEHLPLLEEGELPTQHWAGHLPASPDGDKFFFYWLFAPDTPQDDSSIPLIIWLNGGPGCSSMDGLFLENGPFRFVKDENGHFSLKAAPYSWHKAPAYTLYIDNPVGTGLSFTTSGKYPKNDHEVNVDFYFFLQAFFHLHEDKFVANSAVTREIYFSGESHAGHYIPHMMNHILQQNDNLEEGAFRIPLAGAAIGNGWIWPHYQYAAARAAYGKGLIDNAQLAALDVKEATCRNLLAEGKYSNTVCMNLLDDIVGDSYGRGSGYKVSMYDARKAESTHHSRDFPPGHKVVETYLGGHGLPTSEGHMEAGIYKLVLEALHAETVLGDHKYKECTDPPYLALSHQDGKGVENDVIAILNHPDNVRLLFFNGVEDLICNHVGNEALLENLPWKHQNEWTKAQRYAWKAQADDAVVSGYMKEFDNLMFLKVLNAGHMVPMDVPATALEMMQLLMNKQSFSSFSQGLDRAIPAASTCRSGDGNNSDENST